LAAKQGCTLAAYRNDPDLQDIVDRRFVKAIQASIDGAAHIVASEGYREPTDDGDLFRILEAEGDLGPAVADRMVEFAWLNQLLPQPRPDLAV
jgi:uncharacterized protein YutE (UPF0331/DUF86 family)